MITLVDANQEKQLNACFSPIGEHTVTCQNEQVCLSAATRQKTHINAIKTDMTIKLPIHKT